MSVNSASAWEVKDDVLRGLPCEDYGVPLQGNNIGYVCKDSLCMGDEG
jgi:hypothetical protein